MSGKDISPFLMRVLALMVLNKSPLLAETPATQPAVEPDVFDYEGRVVDEAIQTAFRLPRPQEVLILDPGTSSDRLGIGPLQRGYCFWIVGEKPVKDIAEFERSLLADFAANGPYRCRVVYDIAGPQSAGTVTTQINLSKADLAELAAP